MPPTECRRRQFLVVIIISEICAKKQTDKKSGGRSVRRGTAEEICPLIPSTNTCVAVVAVPTRFPLSSAASSEASRIGTALLLLWQGRPSSSVRGVCFLRSVGETQDP